MIYYIGYSVFRLGSKISNLVLMGKFYILRDRYIRKEITDI